MDTDRLTLREPVESDAQALCSYYARNAERFAPWEPDRPDDVEAHRAWVRAVHASRRAGKPIVFLACDRANAALVAVVDLHGFSDETGGAMIGYTVDGAYEGRGFASEAVGAVIRHASDELGLKTLTAYYDPSNVRSARLLDRVDFRVVGQTPVVPGFERLMRPQVIAMRAL